MILSPRRLWRRLWQQIWRQIRCYIHFRNDTLNLIGIKQWQDCEYSQALKQTVVIEDFNQTMLGRPRRASKRARISARKAAYHAT